MASSIAATAAASTTSQLRFLTDAAHLMRQTAPETSAYLMRRRADVLAQNAVVPASSSSTASNARASSAQAALAFTQTDAQRQHVCTCCGLILIPGCGGTTLTIQSGRSSTKGAKDTKEKKRNQTELKGARPSSKETAHTGITKVFACGSCSRETRISLPPPPPLLPKNRRPRKRAAKEDPEPTIREGAPPLPVPSTSTSTAPSTAEHEHAATLKRPQRSLAETTPGGKSNNANSKKRAKNRKAGLLALLDKSKGADSSSSGIGGLSLSFDDFRKK